ncbi:hypothetical protein SGRA_1056 [Saprospira grandis str. Lewin]|uniref:Uncharacterized protein n=1 Tax=Saprospira grandis (strain Lewin) TaxID=984262 RepID=H6L3E4_SAPGL|nr:hypothetical protein SGRA_1056 [Saprospira grandis str. Lewin]
MNIFFDDFLKAKIQNQGQRQKYFPIFLGLPLAALGSGCLAARSSLGPASFFAALQKLWACRLRRPCCPSLSLRPYRACRTEKGQNINFID